jgi:uncharacterized protein (DUF1684 family)
MTALHIPFRRTAFAALASLLLLPGCTGKDAEADAKAVRAAQAARAAKLAYEREILDWRAERVQRLSKPDGWLSLVGMHWLEFGSTRIGHAADNGTRLAVGPAHLGVLKVGRDGSLRFTPERGADVTVDGQPATGAVALVSDADPARDASVVGFNKGDASFIVIKRGERFALRVRDALAPTRTAFPGIAYFDIAPAFRKDATFHAHPPGHTLDVLNVLGLVEPMANPGTVTFVHEGKPYTLEAVDESDHRLFFVYADRTSGHQSYAASRFLYADYPDARGHTVVDFNKGYNPPCAFTPYSTCPLPPASNRLDLAITAGEMKPRKPAAVPAAVAQR